ncbi:MULTISPECIES: AbrB/MazE/SpoVT family DNA-binding domain-containing protein [Acidianus]|uniref:AbrB family transcriptional regulator n=1 Tax=Candidatus Acidianus copahuensis TaxID=1160895 RepID=A0A031LJB0_9CREN|nr:MULTISPECIES: AbrB/MazE/SpoVT family DNA-binding domain-containing protein [Acidianus]EZQ01641.1 AbrB family transcriptional regulator [Candidatus Acidianus copahuensis]NON61379.1 AbrB/MazE/SpoVT family DNA-binding domain-containing protein [Acidianus sp. RZ1]
MDRVKVTRNYQVTIPSWVRERLSIKEGDILEVELRGDEIVFRKPKAERPRLRLGKKLTLEDIERAIESGINESSS